MEIHENKINIEKGRLMNHADKLRHGRRIGGVVQAKNCMMKIQDSDDTTQFEKEFSQSVYDDLCELETLLREPRKGN